MTSMEQNNIIKYKSAQMPSSCFVGLLLLLHTSFILNAFNMSLGETSLPNWAQYR